MRATPTLSLSLTLAKSLPHSHPHSTQTLNLNWLSSLKSTQLQHIARATGIQSSGTKGILSARIERALAPYCGSSVSTGSGTDNGSSLGDGRGRKGKQSMRILSVDMGIRNLAFAVLRVARRDGDSGSGVRRGSGSGSGSAVSSTLSTPELVAWRRLAVSEIGELDLDLDLGGSDVVTGSGLTDKNPPRTSIRRDLLSRVSKPDNTTTTTPTFKGKGKEKESFSPDHYAKTAYTLITTLLHAYNPTHILIERQRFRSGGASAVQEWTLRVGVLEGMLYAVLETLKREGCLVAEGVEVLGVEPKRVVGFWGGVSASASDEDGSGNGDEGRRRVSAREVKRGKIDLVGRWLDTAVTGSDGGGGDSGRIVIPDENTLVRELAAAYLRNLRGENGRRKKGSTGEMEGGEIGKLDDLADCLLQGITWLEWQVMRERLAREGIEALEIMR